MPVAASHDVFVLWVSLPLVSFCYRWMNADKPSSSKQMGLANDYRLLVVGVSSACPTGGIFIDFSVVAASSN
jgi:hypothetical protein